MNLLKRFASLLMGGGASNSDNRYLTVYALSRRCNEPISGQVDLHNELSKTDEGEYAYYTRKVLHTTGESRCFAQVEIEMHFNRDKKVVDHEVTGGRWLTSDEYEVELARFNAPPEEPEEDEALAEDAAEMNSASNSESNSETNKETTPSKTTPEEANNA